MNCYLRITTGLLDKLTVGGRGGGGGGGERDSTRRKEGGEISGLPWSI